MAGAYAIICLLLLLMTVNYRLSRSVLYPPFIFCGMWLLVLLLYAADLVNLGDLHANTLALVGAGAAMMSMGGVIANTLPARIFQIHISSIRPKPSESFRFILLLLIGVGIVLIAHHTITAAATGAGNAFLERARNAIIEEDGPVPLYMYALPWAVFASVLWHAEKRTWSSWTMTALAFGGIIIGTGRTGLLQLIAALTGVHLLLTDRHGLLAAIRFVRWPVLVFSLLWTGLIFTTKDTTVFGTTTVADTIILFLVGYIVGPVLGLDYVLAHPWQYVDRPHHTFKFFLSIASFLHLIQYTPPPRLDDYAPMSFPTNVYTMYKFFFTDFGLAGTLCVVLVIGFIQTALWRKACTKSVFGVYLYALSLFPLMMCFFDDHYAAFGVILDIALFGFAYLLVSNLPLTWLPRRHTDAPVARRIRMSFSVFPSRARSTSLPH